MAPLCYGVAKISASASLTASRRSSTLVGTSKFYILVTLFLFKIFVVDRKEADILDHNLKVLAAKALQVFQQ